MKGIFDENFDRDVQILAGIVGGAEKWCIANQTPQNHGFTLKLDAARIQQCCQVGGILLNNRFPVQPGAFKRLGVLFVIGQMWPIFELKPRPSGRYSLWIARAMALLIPPSIDLLEVDISDNPREQKWLKLQSWQGFASSHVAVEFLEMMSWLDTNGWSHPLKLLEHEEVRLAQIALSVALILETSYYCGELAMNLHRSKRIRNKGPCLRRIQQDITSLAFVKGLPV